MHCQGLWSTGRRAAKRALLLVAALSTATFYGVAAPVAQTNPAQGPVSHWTFDEGSGDIARDAVGISDASVLDAKWLQGAAGGALYFDGIDTYAETMPDTARTAADFTVSYWMVVYGLAPGNSYAISRWDRTGRDFALGLDNTGNAQFSVAAPDCISTQSRQSLAGTTVALGTWVHVTWVRNSNDGQVILYLDGEEAGAAAIDPGGCTAALSAIRIGGRNDNVGFFNGIIDDVKLWNRPLRADEALDAFVAYAPPPPAPPEPPTGTQPPVQSDYVCTHVIGFSQTDQWFESGSSGFSSAIDETRWQLQWQAAAGISLWAQPNFRGWTQPIVSPCATGSASPDRVILSISEGRFEPDVSVWAANIRDAVQTTRGKFPSARLIVLQPVIGGPDDMACFVEGGEVRAAFNHPIIDQAIAIVASEASDVVAGFSPEVRACSDYGDTLGHLTTAARPPVGKSIGEFYASFDPTTPGPSPVAAFSAAPVAGPAPLTVQFTDRSANGPTSWSWDFGDGVGTSRQRNPSYRYRDAGQFTVTLRTANANGADVRTVTDQVSVDASPPDPAPGRIPAATATWAFDEGTGSVAGDSAGNNTGAIEGAVWTTGVAGSALQFDGVDDRVVIPDGPDFDSADFTVSYWLRLDEADSGERRFIFGRWSRGGRDFLLGLDRSGDQFFTLAQPDCRQLRVSGRFAGSSPVTGLWTHLAWVQDSAAGKITLYIDGVAAAAADYAPGACADTAAGISIGAREDGAGAFRGAIDDVRFWNRVLTADEIGTLYGSY